MELQIENLVGSDTRKLMPHGPSKCLLDAIHWHIPEKGIVGSYTVNSADVKDHFGIFRGVDQIEAFAQATIVSCSAFLEAKKLKCDFDYLKAHFVPTFLSVGNVQFKDYLKEGETFISVGVITFNKWRQITCDGRIYKVDASVDLDTYFSNYSVSQFLNYDLSEHFTLVAELFDITGRAMKREKLAEIGL